MALGVVTPPERGCGPASEGLLPDGVPALAAAACLPLAAFFPDDDPWPAYMATEHSFMLTMLLAIGTLMRICWRSIATLQQKNDRAGLQLLKKAHVHHPIDASCANRMGGNSIPVSLKYLFRDTSEHCEWSEI